MHIFICLIFPSPIKTNIHEHSQHLSWAQPAPPARADQKWPFHCGTVPQQCQSRGNGQHLLEMWIIEGSLPQAASNSFGCEKPKVWWLPKGSCGSINGQPWAELSALAFLEPLTNSCLWKAFQYLQQHTHFPGEAEHRGAFWALGGVIIPAEII